MAGAPGAVPTVYAIADAAALGGLDRVPPAVAAMAAAGVGWIQLRLKPRGGAGSDTASDAELQRTVAAAKAAVAGSGARLWIDDRADLAALFALDGVHVGQRDLPPAAVRRVVGDGVWIGASTHGDAELAAADADPAVDVVAVGPVFGTSSKENPDPVVGLDFVRRARRATAKPLVAIGGIGEAELPAVLAAGADAAAVLSAACREPVETSCRRLLAAAGRAR